MTVEKKSLKKEPNEIYALKFDDRGLIPVIAQDSATGNVLMMAWMDLQAIRQTLDTGRVTYWSRSRQAYWVKGDTSGNTQKLVELRADCDRDCLLAIVEQRGNACHTGSKTCFFTRIEP
ncbi:MAG: phosphoribosyl-AMP cyclohydrolase [Albidovulum sp.]|nr:phosphoribosyl-AMP cyclohydrolase [Albidovulum sp.]MDE0532890.1 phosphoribosyl-AMP cyclohydrolase [Albidovulum sp.]